MALLEALQPYDTGIPTEKLAFNKSSWTFVVWFFVELTLFKEPPCLFFWRICVMIIKGISHFNEKGHSFKMPKELTGSEFTTMLNSSVIFNSLGGQTCPGLKLPKNDIAWWRDSKLGMFIHWGLYSILGRGEWAYFREQIPDDEYRELASSFKPELTPEQIAQSWVSAAQDAGMKYMVMVTRHHDGFSLWDSAGSFGQFTSAAMGSHKDYVQAYANACHNAGMKMGFYYSPMDWRFPGYFHPKEQLDNALKMKQQTYDQITELTTRYGQVDIIWYDGGWLAHKGSDCDSAWLYEPVKLNQIVRQNCPKAVINPRSGWEGDFYCDEGSHEIKGKIIPVPWEKSMCMCTGKSWGWMTAGRSPFQPGLPFDNACQCYLPGRKFNLKCGAGSKWKDTA